MSKPTVKPIGEVEQKASLRRCVEQGTTIIRVKCEMCIAEEDLECDDNDDGAQQLYRMGWRDVDWPELGHDGWVCGDCVENGDDDD